MRETELKIEKIPIDELVPYENNAKKHTREQIDAVEASIKEFGFRNPVIVWRNDDGRPEVVAGHARITAAKNIGMRVVPCVSCDDLSDAQRRALTLVDNQTTMMTGWDEDLLAYEIDVLAQDFDMSEFGFDCELADEGGSAGIEDVEPPSDVESRVKPGEVWELGRHRLMCGDSTDADAVSKLMGGNRADVCFTSPPYNAMHGFNANERMNDAYMREGGVYENNADNLSDEEYASFLGKALDAALLHCDDVLFNIGCTKGALVGTALFLGANAKRFGGMVAWVKSNAFIPMFDAQHGVHTNVMEPVYLFTSDGRRKMHHPTWDKRCENVIYTENASGNEFSAVHGATFPVTLPAEVLNRYTEKSVLDLFGGTGTTMIAAEQLGRACYMMELDPHYCNVAIARWEEMTGKEAVLLPG